MTAATEMMDNGIGTEYSLADALGSIIALTDEDGVVKTRYNYTPFGEPEVIGESSGNPFMFTGREWDPATGLYYYRARYYSPEMGRFISEDPIGLAGGINMYAYTDSVGKPPLETNLYQYALNNPINYKDPTGESAVGWGVCSVAAAAVEWGLAGYTLYESNKVYDQIQKIIEEQERQMDENCSPERRADLMKNITELRKLQRDVLSDALAVGATGVMSTTISTGLCYYILGIPSP